MIHSLLILSTTLDMITEDIEIFIDLTDMEELESSSILEDGVTVLLDITLMLTTHISTMVPMVGTDQALDLMDTDIMLDMVTVDTLMVATEADITLV